MVERARQVGKTYVSAISWKKRKKLLAGKNTTKGKSGYGFAVLCPVCPAKLEGKQYRNIRVSGNQKLAKCPQCKTAFLIGVFGWPVVEQAKENT